MHARKTRERKKAESAALQQRIIELRNESKMLRQKVDERYTAGVLLGLKQEAGTNGAMVPIVPSSEICKDSFEEAINNNTFAGLDGSGGFVPELISPAEKVKRSRCRNKCTPQERLRLRRERNRMHAKRTRDRKKYFLEASERIIVDMGAEVVAMRNYLVSINVLSPEDVAKSQERDIASRKQLALLKGTFEFFRPNPFPRMNDSFLTSLTNFLHKIVARCEEETGGDYGGEDEDDDMDIDGGGYEGNDDEDNDENSTEASDEYEKEWGGSTDEHSEALRGLISGNTNRKSKMTGSTSSGGSDSLQTATDQTTSASNGSASGESHTDSHRGSSNGSNASDSGSRNGSKNSTTGSRSRSNSVRSGSSNCSSGNDSPLQEDETAAVAPSEGESKSTSYNETFPSNQTTDESNDPASSLADILLQFR